MGTCICGLRLSLPMVIVPCEKLALLVAMVGLQFVSVSHMHIACASIKNLQQYRMCGVVI